MDGLGEEPRTTRLTDGSQQSILDPPLNARPSNANPITLMWLKWSQRHSLTLKKTSKEGIRGTK